MDFESDAVLTCRREKSSYDRIDLIIPYTITNTHKARKAIPNTKSIVQIMEATFGAFLPNMYMGTTIIEPIAKITMGYKKPVQKDSCQITAFEMPRTTQINNNIPQAMGTPYFLRDFLKS